MQDVYVAASFLKHLAQNFKKHYEEQDGSADIFTAFALPVV